jgi:hypothetical protein
MREIRPSGSMSGTWKRSGFVCHRATSRLYGSGGYAIFGSHTYTAAGNYSPQVTLAATDSRTAVAISTADITSLTAAFSSLSGTLAQNQSFTGVVATFSDANTGLPLADYSASVDWGDGNTSPGVVSANGTIGFYVTATDVWATPGTLPVSVTITDPSGANIIVGGYATVGGVVANGDTVAANQAQSITGVQVATFTDSDPDVSYSASNYTAEIDWGDGSPDSTGTIVSDGDDDNGYIVSGNHEFTSAGTFYSTVSILSKDGRTAAGSGEADIAGLVVTGEQVTALQGNSTGTQTVADFTDSDPDAVGNTSTDYHASINWGDGSSPTAGTITSDGEDDGGFIVTGSHTFSVAGNYTPTITVTENADGRIGVASGIANIDVPSVTVDAMSISGTENDTFTGEVATFTDLNSGFPAIDYSAQIDWGEDNISSGIIVANGSGSFKVYGSFVPASTGSLTPLVMVTDPSGAMASGGSPDLDLYGDNVASEGSTYTLNLASLDAGQNNISYWSINWGDGTEDDPDIQTVEGNPQSVTHNFISGVSSATVTATAHDQSGTIDAANSVAVAFVPEPPTGLSAVWNPDGSASVTWTNPSAIVSSTTISYSSDGGVNWSTPVTVSGSTSYTFTGLDDTTAYQFSVAVSTGGASPLTSSSTVSLAQPTLTAPSELTFSPSGSSITLSWSDSSTMSGLVFQVEQLTPGDPDSSLPPPNYFLIAPSYSYEDGVYTTGSISLSTDVNYSFRVRVIDPSNAPGQTSAYTYVDVLLGDSSGPNAPVLSAPPPSSLPGNYILYWTESSPLSSVDHYVVEIKDADGTTSGYQTYSWLSQFNVPGNSSTLINGTQTFSCAIELDPWTDGVSSFQTPESTSIAVGQTFDVRIVAVGTNSYSSAPSNIEAVVETAPQPPPPTSLQAQWTGGDTSLFLTWSAPNAPTDMWSSTDGSTYDAAAYGDYWAVVQNGEAYPFTPDSDAWGSVAGSDGKYFSDTLISYSSIEEQTVDVNFSEPYQIDVTIEGPYQIYGWNSFVDTSTADVINGPLIPAAPGTRPPTGMTVPNAPTGLNVGHASGNGTGVLLEWNNSSNNESGFYLYRSINSGRNFTLIGTVAADATSYQDTLPSAIGLPGVPLVYVAVSYYIEAFNAAGTSLQSNTAILSPLTLSRGGPNVTKGLVAMAPSLAEQFSSLGWTDKNIASADSDLNLTTAINDWDILQFDERTFGDGTPQAGTGAGYGTVTVEEGVFDQQAVNYWLAGLIYDALATLPTALGGDAQIFEAAVYFHVYVGQTPDTHSLWDENVADEKIDWFDAGKAEDPSLPVPPPWLDGIYPGTASKHPVSWFWGLKDVTIGGPKIS